jgi:hypothetical protein
MLFKIPYIFLTPSLNGRNVSLLCERQWENSLKLEAASCKLQAASRRGNKKHRT